MLKSPSIRKCDRRLERNLLTKARITLVAAVLVMAGGCDQPHYASPEEIKAFNKKYGHLIEPIESFSRLGVDKDADATLDLSYIDKEFPNSIICQSGGDDQLYALSTHNLETEKSRHLLPGYYPSTYNRSKDPSSMGPFFLIILTKKNILSFHSVYLPRYDFECKDEKHINIKKDNIHMHEVSHFCAFTKGYEVHRNWDNKKIFAYYKSMSNFFINISEDRRVDFTKYSTSARCVD